ncbi:uncharacterized protein M6B38_347395 [Iris pallida]|uniref:Uncharacterized protein n=1 Tax=Iris pallida TaxID=29817 RepID=A0AAX6GSQ6_IRIPA|nr:uncharacterized protein M6B38_347395 [Iris pallida]
MLFNLTEENLRQKMEFFLEEVGFEISSQQPSGVHSEPQEEAEAPAFRYESSEGG